VAAEKAAAAKLKAAIARKNAVASQLDASVSQLNASNARLKESDAALAFSRSKLDDATIHSPASGAVIFKALEKGENVTPGSVILRCQLAGYMSGLISKRRWSVQLRSAGCPVTIESLPGKVFKGKVSEIGGTPSLRLRGM
jgi:multidrug efflux pump subunit AcrA (membrane-fusion protein)